MNSSASGRAGGGRDDTEQADGDRQQEHDNRYNCGLSTTPSQIILSARRLLARAIFHCDVPILRQQDGQILPSLIQFAR